MHDLEDNLNRKDDSAASGASNKFTQTQANANGGNNVTVKKTKSKPKRSAFQRIKKKKAASKPAENESSMASTDASDGATKTPLASAQDAPPSTPASGLPSASTEPSPVSKSDTKVKDDSLSPTKKEPAKSLEEQLDDILEAFLVNTRALTQGLSTRQHIPSNANALQNMDAITRKLVSAYSLAQSSHTGGKLVLSFNGKAYTLDHRRTVSLPELRRLQKQYLRWVGTHPPEDTTEEGISLSFLTYIETQM
uniref:Uncharacterized protein n=2 Tax=Craspedostauros australis TaxID=1486917 RepID=A0A7R9X0Y3_9STRA|mmetsp:Transcript_4726/g.12381  ORF Transcript_4726/g.12381 Transcript_4726/m.12381 type:complete len:251 (+) Transcript_4726:3-755(+)